MFSSSQYFDFQRGPDIPRDIAQRHFWFRRGWKYRAARLGHLPSFRRACVHRKPRRFSGTWDITLRGLQQSNEMHKVRALGPTSYLLALPLL